MANRSVYLESGLRQRHTKVGAIRHLHDIPSTPPVLHHNLRPSWKSQKQQQKEKKKRWRKTQRHYRRCVPGCQVAPATAPIVRCQSLSNIGHPSNPLQWQWGGLAAIHATYIIRHCPLLPGPKRWLLSQSFLCSTKACFAGVHLHKGREIRIYSLHQFGFGHAEL